MIPALDIAKLCQEVYPYTYPVTVQRDDVRMYVRDLPGHRVLLFGATHLDSLEDIIRDLEARPVPDPAIGTCHEGFLRGAQYICLDALLSVLDARGRGLATVLGGHSLGGALALVVGAMLAARGIVVDQVTTFGAPRPGYAGIGKLLGPVQLFEQYRFGVDTVPTWPRELALFPYRHPIQDARPNGSLMPIGKTTGNLLADHGLANYVGALSAL